MLLAAIEENAVMFSRHRFEFSVIRNGLPNRAYGGRLYRTIRYRSLIKLTLAADLM